MSQTFIITFGILSGVLNTIGLAPYLVDIFRHKTKPERATWWIWLALNIVAFAAQVAAGATWSLIMTGAQLMAVLSIAILSVRYGYGKFHKKDALSLVFAGIGLALWLATERPLLALIIVVVIDLVGFMLTISKTWKAPHTETFIAWVFASFSGLLGLLSVGEIDVTKLIYPLYVTIGNTIMVSIIWHRRRSINNT